MLADSLLRGVQKFGASTVTSALHGLIRDDARTRQEFDAQKGHGIEATEGIFRPADRHPPQPGGHDQRDGRAAQPRHW